MITRNTATSISVAAAGAVWIHLAVCAFGQPQRTVGVTYSTPDAFDGYTLFAPRSATTTFLVDIKGRLVQTWPSEYVVGMPAYLLDDGSILRTATFGPGFSRFTAGGVGGRVERIDWDGHLVWAFERAGDLSQLHHDIEPLPNGNVLMMAWVYKSKQEAVEAGRDSLRISGDGLWPETIIEVRPTGDFGGEIVWQWNVWDHLIQDYDPSRDNFGSVSAHPELIDVNFAAERGKDWLHFNGLDYNAELDQILITNRGFNEIWIIDHSTTTEEAAGHSGGRYGRGGDLLYRWGNPAAYRAGTALDQQLFGQHDANWIGAGLDGEGNILVFNNGYQRPAGRYSSVEEITPPLIGDGSYSWPAPGTPFSPTAPQWIYTAPEPTDLYSGILSSAQRLPNGNTLICSGARGTLIEVDAASEEVWRYVNPVISDTVVVPQYGEIPDEGLSTNANTLFRADRFGADHPAFAGRTLTPGKTIEDGALATSVDGARNTGEPLISMAPAHPNPFKSRTHLSFELVRAGHARVTVHDLLGRNVRRLVDGFLVDGRHRVEWTGTDETESPVSSGLYIVTLESRGIRRTVPVLLVR